jgi:hypothetical protein
LSAPVIEYLALEQAAALGAADIRYWLVFGLRRGLPWPTEAAASDVAVVVINSDLFVASSLALFYTSFLRGIDLSPEISYYRALKLQVS